MNENKFKVFILTILLGIIILFLYIKIRDSYIVKNNNNYEIKEFIINQSGEEVKDRD